MLIKILLELLHQIIFIFFKLPLPVSVRTGWVGETEQYGVLLDSSLMKQRPDRRLDDPSERDQDDRMG